MQLNKSAGSDPIGQLIQQIDMPALRQKGAEPAPVQTPAAAPTQRFTDDAFQSLRLGEASLHKGAKGAAVAELQDALLAMGFWTGGTTERQENGVYGTPDGDFGNKMRTAVKNFQDNRGLPQTGVIDQQTFAEIERLAPAKGETIWSPSYAVKDATFVPSNLLPNGDRAKVVVDLSENRLFLFDKNNEVKQVYSVAVGKINPATGKSVTSVGYKQVDSMVKNPAWLGEQLYGKADIFGPKLVGLGEYNPDTEHVKNAPFEIHGTNNENSIGDDASSGCVRMLNQAVEELYPQMQKGDRVYFKA